VSRHPAREDLANVSAEAHEASVFEQQHREPLVGERAGGGDARGPHAARDAEDVGEERVVVGRRALARDAVVPAGQDLAVLGEVARAPSTRLRPRPPLPSAFDRVPSTTASSTSTSVSMSNARIATSR
jgi:hypothetical protein